MTLARIAVTGTVFLFITLAALASVTGTISGTVTDPSDAVIANAEVLALNTETQIRQTTYTNGRGFYSFSNLPAGHYELDIRARGFKEHRQTSLTVEVNASLRVDVQLQVGDASEQVTVASSALHVETASTQMGETIEGPTITSLPLNGRSYTDLLALQPGVIPIPSGEYFSPSVSGALNPGNLSVSGQRESANGFMVNGGNVEEGGSMGTSIIPNLDSIAEFRILTDNFDAEYGNYSGGQVNAITKSGNNDWHGGAFDFLRNTSLDAKNFYSPERGKFNQNQFGGTLGGPLVRNKFFLFADYQGTRSTVGEATGNVAVPSAADRIGNLADVASQLTGSVQGSYWAGILSQELGYAVTAGEPYYSAGCTSSSLCVFPNAVIPAQAFSSPAKALLKYIPEPNTGAFFSTSAYNQTLRDDKGGLRIDANTRWGLLSAYYFIDDYDLVNPYAGANVPGFSGIALGRAQNVNLSDLKIFGSNIVNELRFNFTRATISTLPQGGLGVSLSSQGFVVGPNTPGIVPQSPQFEGVASIGFTDFAIGVQSLFSAQFNNTYQALDNFTKVAGTHTLKVGGDFHYDQINQHNFAYNQGFFGFLGSETGDDFADFLIGAPSVYIQSVQAPLHTRSRYLGIYGQDSWRIRPNLILNYGLRWEFSTPWYETQNQLETLVPGLQSRVFPGAPQGWVFPGDPGIPRSLAPTRYDNFAPRIGLAYSPAIHQGLWGSLFGGPGKTSVRAGFGLFYTSFEDLTSFNEVGDAPYGLFWVSPQPPLFATPFRDRATGNPEGQRFPVTFPPANTSAQNPDNSVNWDQYLPISSSPGFSPANRLPYAEHYYLSVQRQLGNATVLGVSYVGTQGHRLLASVEANLSNPALCLSVSQPSQVKPGTSTCGPNAETGTFTLASGATVVPRGPFGASFGSDKLFSTVANSNYNALEISLRHSTGRMEFLAGYTFSKALDNASGYGGAGDIINPINPRWGRMLSAFDMSHNFVLSYSVSLPFDDLWRRNRLTEGWVLSGITRFSTGLPVFLTENDDNSLLGTFAIDGPNLTPGPLDITDPRNATKPYFNTALFTREALGQLGDSSRRFFHGPGLNNFDIALLKNLPLTESTALQLRFEFFNAFNHAQFLNPTGEINSATFGYVTGARDPRIGQVAVKFSF